MLVILPLAGFLLFFLIWSNAVCWRRSALLAAGGMTVLLSHRGKERNPVNRLLNWSGSLACILGGVSLAPGEAKTGIGRVAPALAVVTFSLAAAWIHSKGSSGAK